MKKHLVLLLSIIACITLFFLRQHNEAFWVLAAYAVSLWFIFSQLLSLLNEYFQKHAFKTWITWLITNIISIIQVAALFFAVLFSVQDIMLFHPNSDTASINFIEQRPEFSLVTIIDGDRSYLGYIRRVGDDEPSPLIIMFLGNAMNSAGTLRFFDSANMWQYFLNYNFLVVDYPGYGRSDGTPTAESINRQALLIYDYASELPFVDESRIIIGGLSIGTGPAVYLAANRASAGLFLLTPFASGYDLYNNVLPIFQGPLRLLVRHKFRSELYAPSVSAPVLIVASQADEIVPFHSSELLAESFPENPTFIILSGVGHNDVMNNRLALDSIQNFLDSIF